MVVFLSKVSRVWRWNVPLIHLRADSGLKNGDVTKSLLYRIMTADTRPNGCSVFNLCEGSARWWTWLPGLQVCCDSLSIQLLITHAEQRRPASLQPHPLSRCIGLDSKAEGSGTKTWAEIRPQLLWCLYTEVKRVKSNVAQNTSSLLWQEEEQGSLVRNTLSSCR